MALEGKVADLSTQLDQVTCLNQSVQLSNRSPLT